MKTKISKKLIKALNEEVANIEGLLDALCITTSEEAATDLKVEIKSRINKFFEEDFYKNYQIKKSLKELLYIYAAKLNFRIDKDLIIHLDELKSRLEKN